MPEEFIDRKSYVWTDSGVEPQRGDETYAGGNQPIAEYDNWFMWAITSDLRAMSLKFGDHSDTHEDGGADEIDLDGMSVGQNEERVITEGSTPAAFVFNASESLDLHLYTSVTMSNSTSSSVSGNLTVSIYEGESSAGTQLLNETQSVGLAQGEEDTFRFLDQEFPDGTQSGYRLNDGPHFVEVTMSGTLANAAVTQTQEFTYSGSWTLWEWDGDFAFEDHWGRTQLRIDGITGNVENFPVFNTPVQPNQGIDMEGGAIELNQSSIHAGDQTVWNASTGEVPQSELGGPASELSYGYPLDGRDMHEGEGSNINADLLRGYTAEDLMDDFSGAGGEWTTIDAWVDYDNQTNIWWSTGDMSTTYDFYKLDIYVEDDRWPPTEDPTSTDYDWLEMWLNGDTSPNYTYDYYHGNCNRFHGRNKWYENFDGRSFGHIATTGPQMMCHQQLLIKSPSPVDGVSNHWPIVTSNGWGGHPAFGHFRHGMVETSMHPINRITVSGESCASCRISLKGRNMPEPQNV